MFDLDRVFEGKTIATQVAPNATTVLLVNNGKYFVAQNRNTTYYSKVLSDTWELYQISAKTAYQTYSAFCKGDVALLTPEEKRLVWKSKPIMEGNETFHTVAWCLERI